jgi:glycosyltransferase involved in cell wall biosynthesis
MNTPPALIHVITSFQLGGAEEVAIDLCLAATRDGFSVLICAVLPPSDDTGEDQIARLMNGGVQCLVIGRSRSPFQLLKAGHRLARIVRQNSPCLVHLHTDIPDFVGAIAIRLQRFRVVRTIHNTKLWSTRPRVGRFVESAFKNDLVVSVSEAAAQSYVALRKRCRLLATPHQRVIFNGVDHPLLDRDGARSILAKVVAWDDERLHLCFAGRLTRQKGFDVLVSALTLLPQSDKAKICLHVFGSSQGDGAVEARQLAAALPVRFYGAVPKLRDYFAAFDAIIMPSRYEGYPLVAVEALAAGVPVLASDAAGLAETLPSNWPLKFHNEDAHGLAKLLLHFMHQQVASMQALSNIIAKYKICSKSDMWNSYRDAYLKYVEN